MAEFVNAADVDTHYQQHRLTWGMTGFLSSSALAAVGLGALQKELDKQGLDILENQRESMATRKQLADLTRGMRCAANDPGYRCASPTAAVESRLRDP